MRTGRAEPKNQRAGPGRMDSKSSYFQKGALKHEWLDGSFILVPSIMVRSETLINFGKLGPCGNDGRLLLQAKFLVT